MQIDTNEEDPDEMDDFELSVIRKDNKFGHDSWGWGGLDKIILFGTGIGENSPPKLNITTVKFMQNAADKLCEALNATTTTSKEKKELWD